VPYRFPISDFRFPIFLLLLVGSLAPLPALCQEPVSPLPPPVTRGVYRSRWFEFLNAHLEDDEREAASALSELKKAAQAVGIRRLSDFSRTAVYEGRQAEAQGRLERAARAYTAALELDDANCRAHFSRLAFFLRHGSRARAAAALPDALGSLFATREARLAVFSGLAIWIAAGLVVAAFGTFLILIVRHLRLSMHSLTETAQRFFGKGALVPFGLIVLTLPIAFGLGPSWLLLYWGALAFTSSERSERGVLAAAFLALGLVTPVLAAISRENALERSSLYVAAADLEEKREDASAEDGLRQTSAVFKEDPDVWLLLGIYAERSSDRERALAAYDKAVGAGPERYQAFLNRGNIRFQEGNFAAAVRDYEAAAERAPRAAEVFYNLALARAESYDFDGQGEALRRARAISANDVAYWSSHPTLAKVVSVSYPLVRARAKVEEWTREPPGRRLPGPDPSTPVIERFLSPFVLGPWAALALGLVLFSIRSWRGVASECVQCGRPHCKYCRRYGDPPGYCVSCARARKELRGIEAQVRRAEEMRRTVRLRNVACRLLSLFLPGTHRFFSGRPLSGFTRLFLFSFLLAAAGIGSRFFGLRQLAPPGAWAAFTAAVLALAGLIWLVSVWPAWRPSHGA
jgi:tetratricopeptide (TPR) repeat protein